MRRSPRTKRDILLWLLSLLIVASMICGLIYSAIGTHERHTPTPTHIVAPTAIVAPSATHAPSGPQPSPQPLVPGAP